METLDFIFDFGSPNAYLVHKVLPEFKLVNIFILTTYHVCLEEYLSKQIIVLQWKRLPTFLGKVLMKI